MDSGAAASACRVERRVVFFISGLRVDVMKPLSTMGGPAAARAQWERESCSISASFSCHWPSTQVDRRSR